MQTLRLLLLIVLGAFPFLSLPVMPEEQPALPMDGSGLLRACGFATNLHTMKDSADAMDAGFCFGVVLSAMQEEHQFQWTLGQAVRVVHRYLNDHPELLDRPSPVLARKAIVDGVLKSKKE